MLLLPRLITIQTGILLLIAILILLFSRTNQRINAKSFQEIGENVSEGDIEKILGVHPGWYASPGVRPIGSLFDPSIFSRKGLSLSNGTTMKGWGSDRAVIIIVLNEQGKVLAKSRYYVIFDESESSNLDRIRYFFRNLSLGTS
jgi:hypothetical protein